MLRGFSTINYLADDVPAAVKWYTEVLGAEPYFERSDDHGPAYVEFRIGDYQHELGLISRRSHSTGGDRTMTELPELVLPDPTAWRDWLASHHDSLPGVWLALHKRGGTVTSLTYADALDEALCFGWIDGQARKRDAGSYWQRMSPRGRRSMWSARNVGYVARLEREQRMHEAGRAAVRAAQADGRWDRAYAGMAEAEVPPDLAEAIAADRRAQAMFDVLTATNRFALIHRTNAAERADTRARKISQFVEMLARHETPYPQKRKPE